MKDLLDSKANGAFGNVDFGDDDFILRDHDVVPSEISTANTNEADIFSAPVTQEAPDSSDWLGDN